jgi:hypothetical protein
MNSHDDGFIETTEWSTGLWLHHYELVDGFRLMLLTGRTPNATYGCQVIVLNPATNENITEEVAESGILGDLVMRGSNERGSEWLHTQFGVVQRIRVALSEYLRARRRD